MRKSRKGVSVFCGCKCGQFKTTYVDQESGVAQLHTLFQALTRLQSSASGAVLLSGSWGLLPNSHGCWKNSIPCSYRTEALSSYRLPTAPCHMALYRQFVSQQLVLPGVLGLGYIHLQRGNEPTLHCQGGVKKALQEALHAPRAGPAHHTQKEKGFKQEKDQTGLATQYQKCPGYKFTCHTKNWGNHNLNEKR